ncbi:MAG: alpha-2-macroglobulin [Aquabacterium sp.]|uniref:Ig-like domain-containing alpha-2-macroglobulin family protein n=1 Tax=Aquabacterium sp. TaxID=1872578 RepID=UPI0025BD37C4|nr:Ig-like domain-containing alpha-2-macroglobulin family protein [Aquabacterium sp.]MBI5925468.1 alpha-2-macroglobulin [Aquabacterium sp.]
MRSSSNKQDRHQTGRLSMLAGLAMAVASVAVIGHALAVTVQTMSPQGEVAKVRQARVTFSDSMVKFGDPRLPSPFDVSCQNDKPVTGTGRWVDDKTWVYDFTQDVPAGTRCGIKLSQGVKALSGEAVTGDTRFAFSTGGPAVVRAYPSPGEYNKIEEEQAFALLLNGAATQASIEKHAYCEVSGVSERLPVAVITGPVRNDILKAVSLLPQQERAVVLRCARPLPPDANVNLVWARGIATPSGVPNSADRKLDYKVRPPFTASFTCERVNSRSDCLPIRPMRIEFSSPVPRKLAERIVLKSSDGEHKPLVEQNRGETEERLVGVESGGIRKWFHFFTRNKGEVKIDPSESAVSAVEFKPDFPPTAAVSIEIPADLKDDSGRGLSNASAFPIKTKTADSPPLAKFPRATFGILELNAEPTLPVTVRHVEGDLAVKGLQAGADVAKADQAKPAHGTAPSGKVKKASAVRDLTVVDDAAIIDWLAMVKRYDETNRRREEVESELGIKLPPPPVKAKQKRQRKANRYGQSDEQGEYDDNEEQRDYSPEAQGLVQTRTVSLLNKEKAAKRLSLPSQARTDPHPFEVIGIPMPQPGFHVVEIESPRLGKTLLDRDAPMFVRTSVLVTNMGVHFKWGAVNSGVWVTTLDKGKPVPEAQVQISDCQGQVVWKGHTDKNGFAIVKQELPTPRWGYCQGYETGREEGYFISARKIDDKGRADMSFVWSTWNDGIESWRFHVNNVGHDTQEPQRFHTVFDRTLLRAGQTVSMQHHARAEQLTGMRLLQGSELPDEVRIVHEGSGQEFKFPLSWRDQRHADTSFKIPEDAKLGTYSVSLRRPGGHRGHVSTGSFRVEEFRLPVMTGRLIGPKAALIQPKEVPIGLQINYGNGGGAAGLPVRVSAQLGEADINTALRTKRFPGFSFQPPRAPSDPNARGFFSENYVDEDDNETSQHTRDDRSKLVADKLAATLDAKGAGNVTLSKLPEVATPRQLLVQATYADPNGEVQTLSQTLSVWPSAIVLGLRTDSWVSVKQKVATQVMALDTNGNPQANVSVKVKAVVHRTSSTRKRLVGGFYAYDNQNADEELGEVCSGTSDARGLVLCEAEMSTTGEVELIAEAKDSGGHLARSAASVWVTRQGEVWFGGDNQDRMDVIPERRNYEAGQVARFQVRSPFRHATALVAIERNGIIETMTVELNGKDPTIEVPVKAEWAPNVYVSVLAVRGRIREVPWYSFFTWGWRAPTEWWHAYRTEGQQYQEPTAMVDLSKPAFKYGIAEIEVGMGPHTLKVEVQPDKTSYPIRANSQVRVKVSLPDGTPVPAGTEVTLAAVDEALLELKPNDSWDLLNAMIKQRGYGVETATAQMQIIGKRHYGKKAAPAGGGGGDFPARELFDTLLLWNPRVVLDAKGEAVVKVPLNDSLTSFRIVVVADAIKGDKAALFGTGHASIRATQDLQILSGVPPLVREGDQYTAMFTLRNTTPKPMDVVLNGQAGNALPEQRVHIEPNAAAEVSWDVTVPFNIPQVEWQVSAQGGGAQDRMKFTQKVVEAVPVTVQQATLMQLDKPISIPIAPPVKALPDGKGALRGGIEVGFKPKLADGLPGVRDFFSRYPWSCLEQKASIAIGLRDTGYWQAIAGQIPLYLDEDGMANYFPPAAGWHNTGSDSLTAYLLSVTDEASKLGYDFHIPPETRDKMERGLIAFVEGRIKRDFWMPAFLKNGDLDVRKLAALEALSRTGRVQPRMLGSIQILPNQWPTGAVIDWLMVLERVKDIPDRDKRLNEAEQVLRARLNVQGTRLGFSTERDDSWWWLMSNGDVNSVRMILGALDKPAWTSDMPRLVTGTLQRQQFGRWSTTVANAWGSVAIEAFSRKFEKDPVSGTSRVGFEPGGNAQALNWATQSTGATLALGWPTGFAVGGNKASTAVKVTHEGTGKPWVTFTSKAAVPVVTAFSSGYRITKTITPVEQKVKGQYSRGDVLRVHLDIDVQADATWVVLNDPVPGGATILGSGLGRDSQMDTNSEKEDDRGWLAYKERSFEAYRVYYRYLPKGSFNIEYTVRLNNPGSFGLPQTRMEAMYSPEMYGESPNAAVVVKP